MLLEEIFEALPNIKILIMLPYVLEGEAFKNISSCPNRMEQAKTEVAKRREMAKRIAEKYRLPFIDLQTEFDKGVERSGSVLHWTIDGVHPNQNGHELISRVWLAAFKDIK